LGLTLMDSALDSSPETFVNWYRNRVFLGVSAEMTIRSIT
jgi:hypothetical protein